MNEIETTYKRLTWDVRFPAPYESGWSIFTKVIVLNNITAHELVELIKRSDISKNGTYAMDCSDSRWIDFAKFSSLLGVKENRLRTGFWDQLGITVKVMRRYEIRRCSKCWEEGYHCVFFDLLGLQTCPWHQCALTKGCVACTAASTFNIRTTSKIISGRFCMMCRLPLPDLDELLSMQPMNTYRTEMVIESCRAFIDWWVKVGQKVSARDLLLGDVMKIGIGHAELPDYRLWQISFANSIKVGDGIFGRLNDSGIAVKYVTWVEDPKRSTLDTQNTSLNDEAGKAYHSLRRHLYRKYIRGHHTCHSCLRNLSRDQSLTLDAEEVCIVSLAFLVWRMSIEGICNIEGLRLTKPLDRPLRFRGPYREHGISVQTHMQWIYYNFFGLWHRLSMECAERNVRVVISEGWKDEHFHWAFETQNDIVDGAIWESLSGLFHALVPKTEDLVRAGDERCRNRVKRRVEMIDNYQLEIDENWQWAREQSNSHRCIFQLRHINHLHYGGHFFHINV